MNFTLPPAPPAAPSVHEILAAGIAGTPIPPPAAVQSGPFAGWRIVAPAGRPLGAPLLIDPTALPSWGELCHARQRIPEQQGEIPSSAAQAVGATPADGSAAVVGAAAAASASAAFLEPATGISPAETPEPA